MAKQTNISTLLGLAAGAFFLFRKSGGINGIKNPSRTFVLNSEEIAKDILKTELLTDFDKNYLLNQLKGNFFSFAQNVYFTYGSPELLFWNEYSDQYFRFSLKKDQTSKKLFIAGCILKNLYQTAETNQNILRKLQELQPKKYYSK